MNKGVVALSIALLVIAGVLLWRNTSHEDRGSNEVVEAGSYQQATYSIDSQPVVLGTSGTKYFGNEVKADMNADGTQDVAFLFTQQPEGSGTFYYIAVALREGSSYRGLNTIFLGDRIAPQTTEFHDGHIIVNYADRNLGEPMTAQPTKGVSRHFTISNGQLVEVAR
jgi:hypothetical protein